MVSRGDEDVSLIMAVENGGDSEAMNRGGLLVQIMDLRSQSLHQSPVLRL